MEDIYDYLKWRGDLKFSVDPFNHVDNLLLCAITFAIRKDIVSDGDTIKSYVDKLKASKDVDKLSGGLLIGDNPFKLIIEMSKSARYKNVKISDFVIKKSRSEINDFVAMLFHVSDELVYVCYQGTGDSYLGWMEDLNMLYMHPIPSQKYASKYASDMIKKYSEKKFILGGHSKGGNSACYALLTLEQEELDHIVQVYSNDGPGFDFAYIDQAKYESVAPKIIQIVPRDCIVGNFLELPNVKRIVVDSNLTKVMEHDVYSWKVRGKELVSIKDISKRSKDANVSIKQLLSTLSIDTLKEINKNIEKAFEILHAENLSEVKVGIGLFFIFRRAFSSKSRKVVINFMRILSKNKLI